MGDALKGFIPAEYIGEHTITLGGGRIYYNPDGTRKKDLSLSKGDILLMPEREILGFTLLHDPHHQQPSLDLGVGWCVLPEHAEKSEAELAAIGYERHLGRPDFQAVQTAESS